MTATLFVKLVNILERLSKTTDELVCAIGYCGETYYDDCIGRLTNAIIDDIQDELDEKCGQSNIDIGEIFWAWFGEYKGIAKKNKPYLLKIDNDEYNAETPQQLYNLFEVLIERFATAENIDYATTA